MSDTKNIEEQFQNLAESVNYEKKIPSELLKKLKIRKRRKNGRVFFYYKDKIIKKIIFWRSLLLAKAKEGKEYEVYLHLKPAQILKLRDLMKIWDLNSPTKTIIRSIDEIYNFHDLNDKKILALLAKLRFSSTLKLQEFMLKELKKDMKEIGKE